MSYTEGDGGGGVSSGTRHHHTRCHTLAWRLAVLNPSLQTHPQKNLGASTVVAPAIQPGMAQPPRSFSASLLGFGSAAAIDCRASNLTQNEVYVHVPLSSGIAVGQRYEMQIPDATQAPDVAGALTGCCYATVIRTDRLVPSVPQELGANLRFDHPLAL